MNRAVPLWVCCLAAAVALTASSGALADPVADFYRGKQVRMIIGSNTGGGYDAYARLLIAHMPRLLPGNPTMVPSNMPGASGMKSAAYLYRVAPRDGTTIATFNQAMGQRQVLEPSAAAQFDVNEFTWIGAMSSSVNILITYHTSGVRTLDDAKRREVIVGALSGDGGNSIYPTILNRFLGTKFKIITGYEGGQSIQLAMERGELDGRGSTVWNSLKSTWPHWIAEKKVHILVQFGLAKDPDLPDVPLLRDLAKTPEETALFRLISSDTGMGFPIVAPPQLPPERAAALRKAFEATLQDKAFLADAEKRGLPIRMSTGAEVDKVIKEVVSTPKDVVDLLKQVLNETKEPAAAK